MLKGESAVRVCRSRVSLRLMLVFQPRFVDGLETQTASKHSQLATSYSIRVVAGGHLESDDWSLTWSPNLTSVFIRWNVRAILYLTAT